MYIGRRRDCKISDSKNIEEKLIENITYEEI